MGPSTRASQLKFSMPEMRGSSRPTSPPLPGQTLPRNPKPGLKRRKTRFLPTFRAKTLLCGRQRLILLVCQPFRHSLRQSLQQFEEGRVGPSEADNVHVIAEFGVCV